MSKIIFLDVDGTISCPQTGVSDRTYEAISKARANGHYVFLCTGRNKAGIHKLKLDLFDGIICSAGGYIEVNNEIIHCEYLSEKEIKDIRDTLDSMNGLYNLEGTHVTYAHEDLNRYFTLATAAKGTSNSELERLIESMNDEFSPIPIKEFDAHPIPLHKICFIVRKAKHLKELHERFDRLYHVVVHASNDASIINGEFIKRTINKGLAIEKLVAHLGLSLEDTVGFGDSMNDYEMMKTCHIGVAMGNASKDLKVHADIICESVEEDGVYHEFKRMGLFND